MIFETPEMSEYVKKNLNLKNPLDIPLKTRYPTFEECFIMLHPFLIVRPESKDDIIFEHPKWPTKEDINKHCRLLNWNEFLSISKMKDIKALDRALAFYHGAYRVAKKEEFMKLWQMTEEVRKDIIVPQVDELPEIIENNILNHLLQQGYEQAYFYSDIEERDKLYSIEDQIENTSGLQSHIRIETQDNEILITQDFDQRFSYILGTKKFVEGIIKELSLDGFYCNDETSQAWSFVSIPKEEAIDRDFLK